MEENNNAENNVPITNGSATNGEAMEKEVETVQNGIVTLTVNEE